MAAESRAAVVLNFMVPLLMILFPPMVGWESLQGTRLKTTQYPCKIDCLSILRHCLTLRSIINIITEVMAGPNGCYSEVVEIWSRTRKSMILSQKTVRPKRDIKDFINIQ